MRVEIIAHQEYLVGLGITVIQKMLDLMRPVDSGALLVDVNRPPTRQGFGEQKHVGLVYSWIGHRFGYSNS